MGRKSRNHMCRISNVCDSLEMEKGRKVKRAILCLFFSIRKYLSYFGKFPPNSILGNKPIIFLWFVYWYLWDNILSNRVVYAKDNG